MSSFSKEHGFAVVFILLLFTALMTMLGLLAQLMRSELQTLHESLRALRSGAESPPDKSYAIAEHPVLRYSGENHPSYSDRLGANGTVAPDWAEAFRHEEESCRGWTNRRGQKLGLISGRTCEAIQYSGEPRFTIRGNLYLSGPLEADVSSGLEVFVLGSVDLQQGLILSSARPASVSIIAAGSIFIRRLALTLPPGSEVFLHSSTGEVHIGDAPLDVSLCGARGGSSLPRISIESFSGWRWGELRRSAKAVCAPAEARRPRFRLLGLTEGRRLSTAGPASSGAEDGI